MDGCNYEDVMDPGGDGLYPENGIIYVSCDRCAMRHWSPAEVTKNEEDDNPFEETGCGRDVLFSVELTMLCPLCHREEYSPDNTLFGSIYDGETFQMNDDLDLDHSSHFKRVKGSKCLFGRDTPNCMYVAAWNKAVAVNKGQSSILQTLKSTIVFDTGHKKYAHTVAKAVHGVDSILGSVLDEKDTLLLISHADADHCSGLRLVNELVGVSKVMFFYPRDIAEIKPANLKTIAKSCGKMKVATLNDQLSTASTIMELRKEYWSDYLLLPAKNVAKRAWTGHAASKNNSSVCLLRCDTVELLGSETRMWIGIAADRDYVEFMAEANKVPGFSGTFDILSLPHHGSHLSTPEGTILARADFYVVQGTPTYRPTDKEAHLNVIKLVLSMLGTCADLVVRNPFATLVFTCTLLAWKDVEDLLKNHSEGRRLTILVAKDCTVEFSQVPIPGSRKTQVFLKNWEWAVRAGADWNDYQVDYPRDDY